MGEGEIIWKSGKKYKGQILDGRPHGRGTFWYTDGCSLSAIWKNDRAYGNGVHICNGERYEGQFFNN